jgi:DNA-binding NtrC family response regulator
MPGNGTVFTQEYPVSGFVFEFCGSLEEAVRLQYWDYALILLDIRFEGNGDDYGLQILHEIRQRSPQLPVVMLSSRATPDILIRCWDEGANAYIVKWTSNPRFYKNLENKIRRHARQLPTQSIIGESDAIRDLRGTIDTLARFEINVLITGETGTGKELVARALHQRGKRGAKPFMAINSAAITGTLMESEMFGHAKGAFTGAIMDRIGKVEEASGGTLFLDEIADLSVETQVKLLRLLDSGEFFRVGENTPRKADLRLVAATNKDLEDLVKTGNFREDLFFRLNGFKVRVPSLRERIEDIPLLTEHFLELFKYVHPEKSKVSSFSLDCMKAMQSYSWPGNVRELRNAIERAVILTSGATVESEALPPAVLGRDEIRVVSSPAGISISANDLPENKAMWPRKRLESEIRLCLEAKRQIQMYKKGDNWRAEFIRVMFPECKAANAKGFNDLIRRLTKGPWGDPQWERDEEIRKLLLHLQV